MRKLRLLLIVPAVFLLNISSSSAVQVSLSSDKLEQYFQILELYVLPFLVVATIVLLCGYIVSRIFNRRQRRLAEEAAIHAPKATPEEGTAAFLRELKSRPPIRDPETPDTPRLRTPRNRDIGQEFREPKFSIGPSGDKQSDDQLSKGADSPLLLQVASAVAASRSSMAEATDDDREDGRRPFPAVGRWDDPLRSKTTPEDEAAAPTNSSETPISSASLMQEILEDEEEAGLKDDPLAESEGSVADDGPLDLGAPLPAARPVWEASGDDDAPDVADESLAEDDLPIEDEIPFDPHPAASTGYHAEREFGDDAEIVDLDKPSIDQDLPVADDIPPVAEPPWMEETPSLSDRPVVAESSPDDGATSAEPLSLQADGGRHSWAEEIREATDSSAASSSAEVISRVDSAVDVDNTTDTASGGAEESNSSDGLPQEAPEIADDGPPAVVVSSAASAEDSFLAEERSVHLPIFPTPSKPSSDAAVVHPLTGPAGLPSEDLGKACAAAGDVIGDTNRVTAKLQASVSMLSGYDKAECGLNLDDVRDLRVSDFELPVSLAGELEAMGEGVVDDVLKGYDTVRQFNRVVQRLEQMAAHEPLDEGWSDLIAARLSDTLSDLEQMRNTLSSVVPTETDEGDEAGVDRMADSSDPSERSSSTRGFPFGRKRG